MAKKLDFIVMGVPRSGTTSFAHYLSSLSSIYCASEMFTLRDDHREIAFPKSLKERYGAMSEKKQTEFNSKTKEEVIFFGHKRPRYYSDLDKILAQKPNLKVLALHRPITPVLRSWDKKAERQLGWQTGRIGLFAFWDYIQFAYTLLQSEGQILLLPFQELYYGESEKILKDVFCFLGYTGKGLNLDFFENQEWREKYRSPDELSHSERSFFEASRMAELIDIFPDKRAVLSGDCKGELRNYFAWFSNNSKRLSLLFDQLLLAEWPKGDCFEIFFSLGKQLFSSKQAIANHFDFADNSCLGMSLNYHRGNIERLITLANNEGDKNQLNIGQKFFCWHLLEKAGRRRSAQQLENDGDLCRSGFGDVIKNRPGSFIKDLVKRYKYHRLKRRLYTRKSS